MKRDKLIRSRLARGSQKQVAKELGFSREQLSKWERGIETPHPGNARKIADFFGATPEELDLVPRSAEVPPIEGSSQEILEQIEIGIAECNSLSDNGGHAEIVSATRICNTYIPVLTSMLASKYSPRAANLMSRIYRHQNGTAYHLSSIQQALTYIEKAVEFARMSKNTAELAVSLVHMASIYEWPLPPLSARICRQRGLSLLEEAVTLIDPAAMPPQIQAWIYEQHAKFLALNARKQDTYAVIGKVQECFAKGGGDLPQWTYTQANVTRQCAIAYSYLEEQQQAVPGFLSLIDVESADVVAKLPMSSRQRLSLISEAVFSLLKAPAKDREITVKLWSAQFDLAHELNSATYLLELEKEYEIMACVFAGDAAIAALAERLHEG